MAVPCELRADLVGAARFRRDAHAGQHARLIGDAALAHKGQYGFFGALPCRIGEKGLVLPCIVIQKVTKTAVFGHFPLDHGHVLFMPFALVQGAGKRRGGRFGARVHHDAAHVPIEAMHGIEGAEGRQKNAGHAVRQRTFREQARGFDHHGDRLVGIEYFHTVPPFFRVVRLIKTARRRF